MTAAKKNPPASPAPHGEYRTSVLSTPDERMQMFQAYVRRFEERYGLSRPAAVAAIAIRLDRAPPSISKWLSKFAEDEDVRPIPFHMLDLLHLEERFLDEPTADINPLEFYQHMTPAPPRLPKPPKSHSK